MSTVDEKVYTADDLLMLPDGDNYEVVDGQLVERKMSQESSWIAGKVHRLLGAAGEDHGIGWAFPEGTSYQCFPDDPNRARRPDASFILRDRLPGGPVQKGHCRVRPDLVAEVVSPNDLYEEVDEKVDEWLAAGVPLVWVVNPHNHTVQVHRADGTTFKIGEEDELTADEIVPGFRCRVGDLFPSASSAVK